MSLIIGLMILIGLIIIVRILWSMYILTKGAFYAGSSDKRIKSILKLAKVKPGDKALDLGSGDGRVLLALAQAGADATGIELDPIYYAKSKHLIHKSQLKDNIKVHLGSFWNHDLRKYDIIIIYGIGHIMEKLENKIIKGAKKEAKIISVHFTFPNLKPIKSIHDVYLYQIL